MSQTCPSMWAKAQGAIVFPPRSGQQTHSSQITKSSLIVLRKAKEEFEKRSSPQQGEKTLSSLRWLGRRRAERSREMEDIKREKEVLSDQVASRPVYRLKY